jgi:hypothetical protein
LAKATTTARQWPGAVGFRPPSFAFILPISPHLPYFRHHPM